MEAETEVEKQEDHPAEGDTVGHGDEDVQSRAPIELDEPEHAGDEEVAGEVTASHTEVGGEAEEEELYEEEVEEEIEGEDGQIAYVKKFVTKKRKKVKKMDKELGGEEELWGEDEEGEEEEEEEEEGEGEEQKIEAVEEEIVEEEMMTEEIPPDPAAPYDLSDSKELLRAPFELREDQLAEVEQLWELYQNYTPAYADLDNYITEVELVYMLKCLNLMTYTPEQMQELIAFCVRPPHPQGHINLDQFIHIVTIRQRDMVPEEELRSAMLVYDPDKTGLVDREYLREVLTKGGHKMNPKLVDSLIKEVDMTNDGTIGVEDVVGTLCIDLNRDDIDMLLNQLYPDDRPPPPPEDD